MCVNTSFVRFLVWNFIWKYIVMLFLEEIRIIKRGEIQWSVFPLLSKFQHITQLHKCWGWKRTTGSHLVQLLCSHMFTYSWLPRAVSMWLFNISRDRDSVVSLDNQCQCSVTLTGKKWFLMFGGNISSAFPHIRDAPVPASHVRGAPGCWTRWNPLLTPRIHAN